MVHDVPMFWIIPYKYIVHNVPCLYVSFPMCPVYVFFHNILIDGLCEICTLWFVFYFELQNEQEVFVVSSVYVFICCVLLSESMTKMILNAANMKQNVKCRSLSALMLAWSGINWIYKKRKLHTH